MAQDATSAFVILQPQSSRGIAYRNCRPGLILNQKQSSKPAFRQEPNWPGSMPWWRPCRNRDILTHTIPLQEARSSSEIENIVTTSDVLYQALASQSEGVDPNAKEVLRYREALWGGVNLLQEWRD